MIPQLISISDGGSSAYAYVNMSYRIPGKVHNFYINSGNGHEWMIPTEVGQMLGTEPWYRYNGVTLPLDERAILEFQKIKKNCNSLPSIVV